MGLLDTLLATSQGAGLLGGLPASWQWQPSPASSTQELLSALQNAPHAAIGGASTSPANGMMPQPAVAAPPQPAPIAAAVPQPGPVNSMPIGSGPGAYRMPQLGTAADDAVAAAGPQAGLPPQGQAAPASQSLPAVLAGSHPAGFLERLNNGLQSLAHGGSLLGTLTGNLTDRSTLAQQNLKAQFEAARDVLRQSGLNEQQATSRAMLAVMNPEAGKAIFAAALANDGRPGGAADPTGTKPKAESGEAVEIVQADPTAAVLNSAQPVVIAASPSVPDITASRPQARAADKTRKATPRQSRPPQDPQAGHSLFGLIPAPAMNAPIFAAPRKPIPLSALGAAVANPAAIFPRR